MAKLRVKNFGPLKEGTGNGFIEFDKVTVLIGSQATGKSSVAKLFSTISYIEKQVFKKEIENNQISYFDFVNNYCRYQGIKNYFKENTLIEYIGDVITFSLRNDLITVLKSNSYTLPKIMYVPAERNFLSVIEEAADIENLPSPLYTFLDEFERSKRALDADYLKLPLAGLRFKYYKTEQKSLIVGEDYNLPLAEASSGIQSLLPLYLVSKNIALSIRQKDKSDTKISLKRQLELRERINRILENEEITGDVRDAMLKELSDTYQNHRFINIVEEIEQNLFPQSQQNLLYELLALNNLTAGNQLVLTTHSPYIINYLTLAIKANDVFQQLNGHVDLKNAVDKVVPRESLVNKNAVNIYELKRDGSIHKLPDYKGIPSDENYLNQFLYKTNELYDQLLEIEEEAN